MTPAQIETARRAMALPGFKVVGGTLFVSGPPPGMGPPGEALRSSAPTHRVDDDAVDTLEMLQQLGWIIRFDDPTGATDGAILRMLGPGWDVWVGATGASVTRSLSWGNVVYRGATLAEACCLCAIDIGRWPGGTG